MASTIWKFPLEITDEQNVNVFGAVVERVLSVGLDPNGTLCIWAEVAPRAATDTIPVAIRGTGNPVPDREVMAFVGTVAMGTPNDTMAAFLGIQGLIWHVYADKTKVE